MRYFLSVDQGTTGTRAILFDENLRQQAAAYLEHRQISTRPGWTEHDPEEIYRNTCRVMEQALASAAASGIGKEEICGMGLANQGETVMAWDAVTKKPLANAVVWHCTRSEAVAERLKNRKDLEALVRTHTGLQVDAYFSATKILWLRENIPKVKEAEEKGTVCYGTLDSWLIFKLTAGESFVTDVSTASRTMLYDIRQLCWDKEILKILDIQPRFLPRVLPNCANFGMARVRIGHTRIFLPVLSSIVDQQGALFGQFCFSPGMVKATYGTGCFLLMNTGDHPVFSGHGLLTSIGWHMGEETCYVLDGAVYMAGAVMQWLRDKLEILEAYDRLDAYTGSLKDNDGVYFVTAFSGLSAPVWDAAARGTIVGLTTNSGKAHIIRAAMESVAYQVQELIECFRADGKRPVKEILADGGLTKSRFLMQFQADLLAVPVVLSKDCEATARGVAMLAGLQAGVYDGLSDLLGYREANTVYRPQMDVIDRNRLLYGWHQAVKRAEKWVTK